MAAFLRQFKLGSNSKQANIVQSHEYHMPINNSDWTIPEEKIEHIYRIGSLDFKTALSVKTHEDIIEKPDGNTLIRFASLRERPSSSYSWLPARHSNYESTEINFTEENTSTFKYKTPVPEVINQNQTEYSPTHS